LKEGIRLNTRRHQERLLQLRNDLRARLERTRQFGLGDSMRDQLGELSLADNHPADVGDELFERSKDLALRDSIMIRLQEVDRALAAMDQGRYGICESCGKPIPPERLEAYPQATRCVACKQAEEAVTPHHDRPVEEEFLWPSFGRTFTDGSESEVVAFDGEDAWQAVARYNERAGHFHDYEQMEMDDNEGIVDPMDAVSNESYRDQLP
jgi:DnaK suppressor protein